MRPPEVFVRELSPEEGARLKSISKRAKYQSKRQRAMILLASSTGMAAPQIAGLVRTDESHVRKVIHAFNEEGFGSLDPDYRGGRPRKTTPEQRDRIVSVARARPDTQGVPLTRWSLPKLRGAPGRDGRRALRGGAAPDADRRRALPPAHALVEVEPGPRLPGEGRARPFALQSQTRGRRGRLLRRDGPDPADPPPRLGLGARQATRAAARDLQQDATGCATCSAPTTSTPTACTGGCASTRTPVRCSASTARSGCATTRGCGST